MSEGKLRVERDGAIGRLVLDNPARRNAIGGDMWRAIPRAMAKLDADPAIRCIGLRGEGMAAFAAGAPILESEKSPPGPPPGPETEPPLPPAPQPTPTTPTHTHTPY